MGMVVIGRLIVLAVTGDAGTAGWLSLTLSKILMRENMRWPDEVR